MTDTVHIALIVGCASVITAAIPSYFSYRANKTAKDTHNLVNSRLQLFMENFKAASKAEGIAQERSEARLRRKKFSRKVG